MSRLNDGYQPAGHDVGVFLHLSGRHLDFDRFLSEIDRENTRRFSPVSQLVLLCRREHGLDLNVAISPDVYGR